MPIPDRRSNNKLLQMMNSAQMSNYHEQDAVSQVMGSAVVVVGGFASTLGILGGCWFALPLLAQLSVVGGAASLVGGLVVAATLAPEGDIDELRIQEQELKMKEQRLKEKGAGNAFAA